jgi:hypothetical protein
MEDWRDGGMEGRRTGGRKVQERKGVLGEGQKLFSSVRGVRGTPNWLGLLIV